jgi:hypothetical protein
MGLKKDILQEREEQQLRWYGHTMGMEDCKTARQVAGWNPQEKRRHGRPVNTGKDGVKDSIQRRNLKDEECFDREQWTKETVFGLRKTVYTQRTSYIYNYIPCQKLTE